MHSKGYDLDNGKTCVVHHDGDATGYAIWTIVENNERIVETERDIEDVQIAALTAQSDHKDSMNINSTMFPLDAIVAILGWLAAERIAYIMDDKLDAMPLVDLIAIEDLVNLM